MCWYMRSSTNCTTSRAGARSTGRMIFIEAESKETTELRFIPQSGTEPVLVRKREPGVRYDAASHAPRRNR